MDSDVKSSTSVGERSKLHQTVFRLTFKQNRTLLIATMFLCSNNNEKMRALARRLTPEELPPEELPPACDETASRPTRRHAAEGGSSALDRLSPSVIVAL